MVKMMENIKNVQDQIDNIMDAFDFERVYQVMKALNWQWAQTNGVPTVIDIKKQARKLLKETAERNITIETGGFHTMLSDGVLGLSFVVDEWWGDDDE